MIASNKSELPQMSEVCIEFSERHDQDAQWYETFPSYEAAVRFTKALLKMPFEGFIRIFVPPSLANDGQLNELRVALGLTPIY